MKTTVKLDRSRSITVHPREGGRVVIGMLDDAGYLASWGGFAEMTPDQAGALIFGIEQALEAAGIRRDQAVLA